MKKFTIGQCIVDAISAVPADPEAFDTRNENYLFKHKNIPQKSIIVLAKLKKHNLQ